MCSSAHRAPKTSPRTALTFLNGKAEAATAAKKAVAWEEKGASIQRSCAVHFVPVVLSPAAMGYEASRSFKDGMCLENRRGLHAIGFGRSQGCHAGGPIGSDLEQRVWFEVFSLDQWHA